MVKQKKDKRSRKAVFGFVALFAAVAVIVGVGYAYFSDVITGQGTATTGTLDLTGSITCTQPGLQTLNDMTTSTNNSAMTGCDTLNLNPGDAIVPAVSSLANAGNKSAWIRTGLTITAADSTIQPYLYVCDGTKTQAEVALANQGTVAAGTAFSSIAAANGCVQVAPTDIGAVGTGTFFTAPVTAATATLANVIPGTGTSAETEGTFNPATATVPFIYLDAAAPNSVQNNTSLKFTAEVQALQYRNNTTYPTNAMWNTVVTVPYGS